MGECAVLYMRLSRDDGRCESAGIESQRLLLRAYAERQGFCVTEEYIDDGYSGTSWERPAFRRMLADIEEGRVRLVLVKDLSRLGRNYIATGELTEVYFPEHRVRLIAVNDGYDSEAQGDDMAPFRHVMNEMYARDISRKIRTALRAKMLDGQYIGSFAPYGYRKSDGCKNRLVRDGEAAEVVRQIFLWAADGVPTASIAERLNEQAIPIPLDYRRLQLGMPSEGRRWRASGVCKILRNVTYLGHTVQGKSTKPSLKSPKCRSRPRGEWIVARDTHEPLVGEELFALAQARGKEGMRN